MKVLDTSVLIDLDRDQSQESIKQLKTEDLLCVSSVSVFEFWWGICIRYQDFGEIPKTVEKQFFDFFSAFEVIEVDMRIAQCSASLGVDLKKRGLMIDLHDLYIAATAKITNIPLITRNAKHFSRIKNIEVIKWPIEEEQ